MLAALRNAPVFAPHQLRHVLHARGFSAGELLRSSSRKLPLLALLAGCVILSVPSLLGPGSSVIAIKDDAEFQQIITNGGAILELIMLHAALSMRPMPCPYLHQAGRGWPWSISLQRGAALVSAHDAASVTLCWRFILFCAAGKVIAPIYDQLSKDHPTVKFTKVDIDSEKLAVTVMGQGISSVVSREREARNPHAGLTPVTAWQPFLLALNPRPRPCTSRRSRSSRTARRSQASAERIENC